MRVWDPTPHTLLRPQPFNPLEADMTYAEMERLVNKGREPGRKNLKRNTWLVRWDEDRIDVVFHGTAIVKAFSDGSYILDSGGWQTSTTKGRINEYAPVYIYQKKHVWYISWQGQDIEFVDGMKLQWLENGGFEIKMPGELR